MQIKIITGVLQSEEYFLPVQKVHYTRFGLNMIKEPIISAGSSGNLISENKPFVIANT